MRCTAHPPNHPTTQPTTQPTTPPNKGYIGTLSLLEAIAGVARALRAANPGLTYVCDPVLGDEGKCYVTPELVGAYRAAILPLASILTPNQFEAGLLTGLEVGDEAGALAACGALHEMGPHTVVGVFAPRGGLWGAWGVADAQGHSVSHMIVISDLAPTNQIITSIDAPGGSGASGDGQEATASAGGGARQLPGEFITLVASTRLEQRAGRPSTFRIHIPKLNAYFTGTGDEIAGRPLLWGVGRRWSRRFCRHADPHWNPPPQATC